MRDSYLENQNYILFLNHFAAFGLRCGHPGQQHGRFFPSAISERSRSICSVRVSAFFTIVTQQIHSLRARGVRVFHVSRTSWCAISTSRISSGMSWKVSPSMSEVFLIVDYCSRSKIWYSRAFFNNSIICLLSGLSGYVFSKPALVKVLIVEI